MNQKGQSLIEALIALGAAVIIVAAITIAVITAVGNSDFSKYQNLATGYAQQGIQIVTQKSQLDWVDTATYSGTWCLPQGTTDFYTALGGASCSINVADKFVRELDFTKVPPSCDTSTPCCSPDAQYAAAAAADSDFCAVGPTHHSELCSSQIKVTVKWTDGKCSESLDFCHHVILDSCITDINRSQ
jgi:Tfp pilus assembly protein PilV